MRKIGRPGVCSFRRECRRIASLTIFLSMNAVHLLFLALSIATAAEAQDTPVPKALPADAPDAPATPPAPPPVEVVKPAIQVAQTPVEKPLTFTQDQVQEQIHRMETALKKQTMLVGMGSGVVGLLLGMMIGRKSAPRSTGRRF